MAENGLAKERDLTLERPRSLTEIATERLAGAIVGGQFRLGERLVESTISADLGISRAPLREALRALASEGLVEIHQSRGTFVAKPSQADLEAMVLLRALVEGAAIRLLAYRRDEPSLLTLDRLSEEVSAADRSDDHNAFLEAHWAFHRQICLASGNRYLLQAWDSVSNLIRLYHRLAVGHTIDRRIVLRNNFAFIKCLRSGSPDEAEELLRSQIIRVAYRLIGVPIPANARGYVTRYVTPDGSIAALKPEDPIDEAEGARE